MQHTRIVLRLCDRFHCLPSQIMAEDAITLLRLLQLEHLDREQ